MTSSLTAEAPHERLQVTLLPTYLAAALPLFLVISLVSYAARTQPVSVGDLALGVVLTVAIAVAYVASRIRRRALAAGLLTAIGVLGPLAAAWMDSGAVRITFALLFVAVGIVYGALFFELRTGLLVALGANLAVWGVTLLHPTVGTSELVMAPCLLGVLTGLILVGQRTLHRSLSTIRRQARQLRDLIERTPSAMAVLENDRIAFANPALASALGIPGVDAIVGTRLVDHAHADDRKLVEDPPLGAPFELRLRRPDGSYRLFTASMIADADLAGDRARLLAANDITEQRAIRERLVLTERLASLGTIAASVGHEINNPLTFVLINLDFVRDELPELLGSHPEQDRVLELMGILTDTREGAKRASDIVTELKAFARIDDEESELVDLRAVVRSSLRVAGVELRHRAQVREEWGDIPFVQGGASRVGQVFLNLLVNAAHAISPGAPDQNEVHVRTYTDQDHHAVVEISDTGVGIPAELHSRIFEPFFTTKPPGQGTGLGLAICVKIIRDLNGQLEMESTPGRGTRFRVRLPPATAAAPETVATQPNSVRLSRLSRVLVIDDDRSVAEAIQRLLRGYVVEIAFNGQEALRLCRKND